MWLPFLLARVSLFRDLQVLKYYESMDGSHFCLQADATAADPMVDGRIFRGSDAWRLLVSLQGSLPESEGTGMLRKGACKPSP